MPPGFSLNHKGCDVSQEGCDHKASAEAVGLSLTNSENCEPQYGVLPSSIAKVTCPSMSAFMLQDLAPWIALQAMDGSGELCPY